MLFQKTESPGINGNPPIFFGFALAKPYKSKALCAFLSHWIPDTGHWPLNVGYFILFSDNTSFVIAIIICSAVLP